MAKQALVMGIDVGGQTTKLGVVDARGNILYQSVISSLQRELSSYVEDLTTAIKDLIKQSENDGEVKGFFAKMIRDIVGIPVAITNDANAAAVGEMTYGIAKGMKDFIMITLGTGVGSGIVIDGKIVYGHDGFAGELGHTTIIRGGRQCNCGRKGCLETYTSATGVARTAREFLTEREEPSLLRNLDPEKITSKDIYEAATKGDKLAIEIFHYTGKIMGEAFADFVAFSAPEAIILFGGLAKSKEFLTESILESMNDNLLNIWKGKIRLLYSTLKDSDAAILGASALAWEL